MAEWMVKNKNLSGFPKVADTVLGSIYTCLLHVYSKEEDKETEAQTGTVACSSLTTKSIVFSWHLFYYIV